MATNVSALRNTEDLVAYVRAGGTVDYLHFWGHQPDRDTGLGAGCLSQWWPVKFTVDGVTYPTAEHYMMAGKAALFGDDDMGARILRVADPAEAKRLGREVRGFDGPRWSEHRSRIVVDGNLAKFGQNPALRDFLLGTGERVLVEASPRDRIWGIGLAASNEDASLPERWRGRNLLGFALMEVRSRLRAAAGSETL